MPKLKLLFFLWLIIFCPQSKSQADSFSNSSYIAKADSAWDALPKEPNPPSVPLSLANFPLNIENVEINLRYFAKREIFKREFREAGLRFWHNFPNDPRRYKWLLATVTNCSPSYWRNVDSGARIEFNNIVNHIQKVRNGDVEIIPDTLAIRLWLLKYISLREDFLNSFEVPDKQKMDLIFWEIYSKIEVDLKKSIKNPEADKLKLTQEIQQSILYFADKYYKSYKSNSDDAWTSVNFIRSLIYNYKDYGFTLQSLNEFFKPLSTSADPLLNYIAGGVENLTGLREKPFELKFKSIDGRIIDLKKMRGKIVLLDFWATWCESCMENMPYIKEVFEKYNKLGFEVVSICINPKKDIDAVRKIEKKICSNWPVVLIGGVNAELPDKLTSSTSGGLTKKIWDKYGFNWVPQLLLLDQNGKLIVQGGALSYRGLEAYVKKYLDLEKNHKKVE